MQSFDTLIEKWSPVLNEESAGAITDPLRKAVTAAVLENQEKALMEERASMQGFLTEAAPTNSTGGQIANWDPVLISLVRRAMPNLMAYDLCGVQPMSGPTGLIFTMKSHYNGQGPGDEALGLDEPRSGFSGAVAAAGESSGLGDLENGRELGLPGRAMSTSAAEKLGGPDQGDGDFAEMGFSIEKQSVVAKSRALKAEYSLELAQDLKAIHGLDAETELANILSTEILAEINREIVRSINSQAVLGAQTSNVASSVSGGGIFDISTDADGRWSAEKFKALAMQIEREANAIAKDTRRGKGNIVVCSADVATALAASGSLDYQAGAGLTVDTTGNTFAGTINGRIRVFIDPYADVDYVTVGYKGTNAYDAGMFYCPYVPLQMMKAVAENTFQPKIGFKTRYGMAANPFVAGPGQHDLANTAGTNTYYRIFRVDNLMAKA